MSNHKDLLQHKLIKEPIPDNGEEFRKVSSEELKNYVLLQSDQLKSEASILSKIYQLPREDAEEALELTNGDYNKALYFTDYILKILKIGKADYISAFRIVCKDGLKSLIRQPVSLLEQEVMNFDGKFNLKSTQTYHRDVPGSSTHYDEHNATKALDQDSD